MKLKEVFYRLGIKPKVREYPFDLDSFVLSGEGELQFARWRHPKEEKKRFSQGAVDMLRSFLREGDAAVDIGAHTGDSTLPMALAVGPKGAVFALEPNPYVFKVLLANSALNRKATNIHPLMFAATPEDGEFDFDYSDPGFCNGGNYQHVEPGKHAHFFKLKVRGRNLAAFLEKEFPANLVKIRYIKIDTEGFDRVVAASLQPLIKSNRPHLKSEIHRHMPPDARRGYHGDLRGLGYRIHKVNSDQDYRGVELRAEDMMKWPHFDVFAVPE